MFCVFCDREFNLEAIYYLVSGFLLFSLRGIFMLVLYSCLMIIILFNRITWAMKIYVKIRKSTQGPSSIEILQPSFIPPKQNKKGLGDPFVTEVSGYTRWNKPQRQKKT